MLSRVILLNLLVVVVAGIINAECPNIVSREEWVASPGLTSQLGVHPASHVLLHHSSTPTCDSLVNCAALVRSIQRHHMTRQRYGDIGYNFLVGEDGNVYEGVGWSRQGTHDDRLNSRSIGICIIGDYTSWLPNEAALNAVQNLIECGVETGQLSPRYKILSHKQIKHTDCPGSKLSWLVRIWKNWSAAP